MESPTESPTEMGNEASCGPTTKKMQKMVTICVEDELYISDELAKTLAKDRFKGAVMTEYQNEIWELAVSQKPGTNKWQLSWEKSTKKFMRDTKGDPWEEKSTDKSPKIKRKKAQEAETTKDDEEETVGAAETPKIRKKKAQEAETTKDDDEETVSRKQQRTR